MSRSLACDKLIYYIDKKKKVWCDIKDEYGKINDLIMNVEKPSFRLILKNGEHILGDNFLYNITYNMKRDDYSLTEQDEYFEEIEVGK